MNMIARRQLLFAGATIFAASIIPATIAKAIAPQFTDIRGIHTLPGMVAAIERMFGKVEDIKNVLSFKSIGSPLSLDGSTNLFHRNTHVKYALGYVIPESAEDQLKMKRRLIVVLYKSLRNQANKSSRRLLIWRERPELDVDKDYDTKIAVQQIYARCIMV